MPANEAPSDAGSKPAKLGLIERLRQRIGRRTFNIAAIVAIVALVGGAWCGIQEIRCRMLASRIRQFLEDDGPMTFAVPNLEPRTVSGVDLSSVADCVSIKMFRRASVDWACIEAISLSPANSQDSSLEACDDWLQFTDRGVEYLIQLDNDLPHRRLIKLSPWTQDEYETVWAPGAWESITAE